MANLFAQNSANWDSANMWNTVANGSGSYVTPGASDVCMANNKAVAVNISPTVAEVRHDTTGGATGGGSFTLANGVTLTANVYGNTSTGCLLFSGNSTAYLVGNLVANGSNGCYHTGIGTLTITGSVTGSASASGTGMYDGSTGICNITGNITAGSYVSDAYGVRMGTAVTVNIIGNVLASAGRGVSNESTGTVNITGSITANSLPGVVMTSTGRANVTGPLIASATYQQPIQGQWRFLSAMTSTYMEVYDTENTKRTLYTSDYNIGGLPSVGNVRSGTTFGPSNELTGTLAVPPAASVAYGVPVDATTGTAVITAATISAAVWDTLVADLDTANSIGARLAQAATVPSTGAQIAALGV